MCLSQGLHKAPDHTKQQKVLLMTNMQAHKNSGINATNPVNKTGDKKVNARQQILQF